MWIVAVDSEHVYVSDQWNHRVQIFSREDGAFVRKWGGNGHGDGQFQHPYGVAVDSEHVYVVDIDNHRVQVFR
jgi:DNA-binding beta-propeller fold protein YncE